MEARSQCWGGKNKDFSAWDGCSEEYPLPPQFLEQDLKSPPWSYHGPQPVHPPLPHPWIKVSQPQSSPCHLLHTVCAPWNSYNYSDGSSLISVIKTESGDQGEGGMLLRLAREGGSRKQRPQAHDDEEDERQRRSLTTCQNRASQFPKAEINPTLCFGAKVRSNDRNPKTWLWAIWVSLKASSHGGSQVLLPPRV